MIVEYANQRKGILRLGKSYENGVTSVVFNIERWISEIGEGTAVLLHMRPEDESPYPVSTIQGNGIVTWVVSSTDTAQAGIGKCELQYIVDEDVVKSKIWKTLTIKSLDDAGETPDPESGWVAELLSQIQEMVDGSDLNIEIATDEETEEMLSEIYG